MKPKTLTPEQRKEIDRRRKGTLDRFLYERLTAVLAVAEGHTPEEVADFLGVGLTQPSEWLLVYRNEGLDALCTLAREESPPSDH
jgi:transposase